MNALDASHPLQALTPRHTIRGNEVVSVSTVFHRMYRWFCDLIYGAQTEVSIAAFYDQFRSSATALRAEFAGNGDPALHYSSLKNLIKLVSKIEVSRFGKELGFSFSRSNQTATHPMLRSMRDEIDSIQEIAKTRLHDAIPSDVTRWIQSNAEQQRYAAFMNHETVPYRYDEIPAGSILLTHPSTFAASLITRGKPFSLGYRILLKVKEILSHFITRTPYTHAELMLSDGKVFDLFKEEGELLSGVGYIKELGSRVCYRDIIAPKQQLILEAHQRTASESQAPSYKDLISRIELEVAEKLDRISAKSWDIIKTCFPSRRAIGYHPASEWKPGEIRLGCSPYISALFGYFGIDLGKEANKMHRSMTPADLKRSGFFEPLYTTS